MGISAVLSAAGAVPVGVVNPFAGANAPAGWLLCYGQAVSRTEYPALFNTLSTVYGSGDGSTTFNVPDLRGRTIAGVDNMGGTDAGRLDIANSSGTVTGSQYVTLTSAQSGLPAHSHANTASFSGSFSGTAASHTHTQNAHEHLLRFMGSVGGNRYMIGDYGNSGSGTSYFIPSMTTLLSTAVANYSIAEGVTATNQNTSITPAGSISGSVSMSNANNTAANAASAHDNMQPTIILNYIIKAQ